MKSFLLKSSIALLLACGSVAVADDDKEKNTEEKKAESTESTKEVIISTVEIVDDDGEKKESKKTGRVRIRIEGDEKGFAFGDDEGGVEVEEIHQVIKDGEHEISVRASIFGNAIVVGPDGKTKEFKLGDAKASKELLKNLPEEVRKRVEKAMSDTKKGAIFGNAIMIGPDGKREVFKFGESDEWNEALKSLPEGVRKRLDQAMKKAGNTRFNQTPRDVPS